jgi:hypothetical protein
MPASAMQQELPDLKFRVEKVSAATYYIYGIAEDFKDNPPEKGTRRWLETVGGRAALVKKALQQ